MRRKYAQLRDLKESKKQVRNLYDSAVDYFSKEFEIPKKSFPKLKFVSGEKMSYNQADNKVLIGDKEFISDIGDSVGEELGHFVRAKIKGRVGKKLSQKETAGDEFYGFLGSRILYRTSNEDQKKNFFTEGERTFESTYEGKSFPEIRQEILGKARSKFIDLGKRYRDAEKNRDQKEMQRIYQEAKKQGYEKYTETLAHARPYHFASEADLDKIKNLRELYSLSDKEVKEKFFKKSKNRQPSKGLEKKLGILSISSLIAFLFFSSPNITSNVVGGNANKLSNFSIIFLLGAILFGVLAISKLQKIRKYFR
ncbi:hypothetical protein GF378_02915 [Candidatus Pacearchaeota archaeon]|nr:hypothetical protein [Candidatus Pacearchaeota archaeon]